MQWDKTVYLRKMYILLFFGYQTYQLEDSCCPHPNELLNTRMFGYENYKHRYTHMSASNKYKCTQTHSKDIFFISKLIIIDWSITLCDVTPKSRILIVIKLIIWITLVTNLWNLNFFISVGKRVFPLHPVYWKITASSCCESV
jgi:hypothetical protein